eukprot:CAMPEP_0117650272 /NCGR_PEP_ID=MMETSP0804-20121206/1452_1 /TAXON_ID=1074897 /ORGANISM="Tetraselmis astigmatica, Strain CCMP880" /LENGTH=61 /DNA_ID=CAMNT_0005456135 /DNA_START=433 /DNA_END=615 /DNA_ORIENTATION=+
MRKGISSQAMGAEGCPVALTGMAVKQLLKAGSVPSTGGSGVVVVLPVPGAILPRVHLADDD